MKKGTHYIQDCINITINKGFKFEGQQAQRQLERLSLTPEFLNKIDWEQLKEQKQSLIENGNFDGIVNLLDAIQDYAVDMLGIEEKSIFMSED